MIERNSGSSRPVTTPSDNSAESSHGQKFWDRWMSRPWRLCLISALLMVLSHYPFNLGPLILVAFVPWLLALPAFKRGRVAFFAGWCLGTLFYAIDLYWLSYMEGGSSTRLQVVAVWAAVCSIMALYYGLFALLARWLLARAGQWWGLALAPLLWVGLEYGRYFYPAGAPFLFPGYALHQIDVLIQSADIAGVQLVSLFVLAVNVAIAARLLAWRSGVKRTKLIASGVLVGLFALNIGYGIERYLTLDARIDARGPVLALVQGGFGQDEKNQETTQHNKKRYERHVELSEGQETADMIVWSETAHPWTMPGELTGELHDSIALNDVIRTWKRPAVIGSLTRLDSKTLAHYPWLSELERKHSRMNSAWYFGPDGRTIGRHDKSQLVPGGEYIPFRGTPFGDFAAGFAERSMGSIPAIVPGWRFETHSVKDALGKDWRFSNSICYEFQFTQPHLKMHSDQNVHFQINLSNEAWYLDSWEMEGALVMSRFRAIESRVAMARCTNTGITCTIDPLGRVGASLEKFEPGVLRARISCFEEPAAPPFLSIGNLPWQVLGWLTTALTLLVAWSGVMGVVRRRKSDTTKETSTETKEAVAPEPADGA